MLRPYSSTPGLHYEGIVPTRLACVLYTHAVEHRPEPSIRNQKQGVKFCRQYLINLQIIQTQKSRTFRVMIPRMVIGTLWGLSSWEQTLSTRASMVSVCICRKENGWGLSRVLGIGHQWNMQLGPVSFWQPVFSS